jgi:hypothetical protein
MSRWGGRSAYRPASAAGRPLRGGLEHPTTFRSSSQPAAEVFEGQSRNRPQRGRGHAFVQHDALLFLTGREIPFADVLDVSDDGEPDMPGRQPFHNAGLEAYDRGVDPVPLPGRLDNTPGFRSCRPRGGSSGFLGFRRKPSANRPLVERAKTRPRATGANRTVRRVR